MSEQFKAGPWRYAFEGGTVAFITDEEGYTVGKISTLANSTAHSDLAANVRLMASAPSLYAALEAMLERTSGQAIYSFMEPDRKAAYAALARARGEA